MLLQAGDCSHDKRQSASVSTFPGEVSKYTSPESKSHCLPYPTRAHPTVGAVPGGNTTVVAPEEAVNLVHGRAKWLHQPLEYNVTLAHCMDALHKSEHSSRLSTKPGELVK